MKLETLGILLVSLALVGCGKKKEEDKGEDTGNKLLLFNSVSETAPKVKPAGAGLNLATGWNNSPLEQIYGLIREYNNDRDNGVIDGSNMWKALYDASLYAGSITSNCTDFAEKSVASPLDFGGDNISQTYNCGIEGTQSNTMGEYTTSFVAKKGNEAIQQFLMGWAVVAGTSTTQTVYQGTNDTVAKTVKLNQNYLVTYSGTSSYQVRLHLEGNTDSGLFTMKLGGKVFIGAHGYAKGDGKFYLFRVTTAQTTTPAYFCLKSSSTDADLQAIAADTATANGSATVPADCSALESGLPTTDYVNADLPVAASFTGLGAQKIGLSY